MSAPTAPLAGILGEDRLSHGSDLDAWAVGGVPPEAVVEPRDAGEVAELLRWAGREGVGVVPRGGGAFLGGRRPRAPFVVLRTARLAGIETYEPDDLTLVAGAGITLAEADEALARHGQWCPFDPPGGMGRSLGGLLASGHSGPLAAGFGTPRDHLLGATVVTGDGRALRLGGRVVKNVAGFDALRVMVGSRGTLAVLVSACVRVFPRPAAERALVLEAGSAAELIPAARAVATAPVVPSAAALRAGGDGPGAELTVLVQGAPAQVDADHATLEVAAGARFAVTDGPQARERLEAGARRVDQAPVSLRLRVLPDRLGEILAETGAHVPGDTPMAADVMSGTLRVGLAAAEQEELEGTVTALRSAVDALGGALSVEAAHTAFGLAHLCSHAPGAVAELETELRGAFDPHGVLWRTEEHR